MENYIVSARKYRPSTFDSVVGQRALTTTLKKCYRYGKVGSCLSVLRTARSGKNHLCPYLCQDYQLPYTRSRWRGLQPMRILHGFQ